MYTDYDRIFTEKKSFHEQNQKPRRGLKLIHTLIFETFMPSAIDKLKAQNKNYGEFTQILKIR